MKAFDSFYGRAPLVIAHRGARDIAPENTLAAFRAAIAADADGIELDVTRCATGEIVVIHDSSANRTTDGTGQVARTPFFALRELDAGSWFAPEYADQRIPTLGEVLALVGHRLRINIEIKGMNLIGNGIEVEIAQMIRERGLGKEALLSSFNPLALLRARRAAPTLQRGLLYGPKPPLHLVHTWMHRLISPHALHPHHSMVNEQTMRWARRRGYRVNVWTVNDPETMQRIIRLGVDAVITDHPARLRELLPRRALGSDRLLW